MGVIKFPINCKPLVVYRFYCIEDIYFFEVNTKYISSSAVKKSSENADIFNALDEIYLVFAEKNVNFFFSLYSTEIQKAQPNFFLWSFLVRFDFCSVFIV